MTDPVDLELDRSWTYGVDVQHGGRLLELVTGAGLGLLEHPHPLAVSAHFLSASRLGAATVERELLRQGRSVSTVRARLVQGGRTCLEAVVTAGRLGEPGPPTYRAGGPPVLPPLEQCLRGAPADGAGPSGLTARLDMRLDPAAPGWLGEPTGEAEIRAWIRLADGREVDPLALVCLADALPPVTACLGLRGWAPTVELTVYVRAVPAPGWLRIVQRAQVVADGWLDETCEIWDSTDRLVAQGFQLAGYRVG